MAVYVSKNGDQFEDIIRAKKDPRFEFLEEAHEFNKYYKEKLRDLKGETKPVQVEKKTEKEKQVEDKREVTNVKEKDVREVKIVKKEKKVIGKYCIDTRAHMLTLLLQYFNTTTTVRADALLFIAYIEHLTSKSLLPKTKQTTNKLIALYSVKQNYNTPNKGTTFNAHVVINKN